jgi:hypothetical protein
MMSHVHDLKPGSLGLVAHNLKPYELNGWVRGVDIKRRCNISKLIFHGHVYCLNVHVPHGTLVLVVSEQKPSNSLESYSFDVYNSYYEVLWGETVLFLKKETLLNPYFQNEEP